MPRERDRLISEAAEQGVPLDRIAEAAGFKDGSAVKKALKRIEREARAESGSGS